MFTHLSRRILITLSVTALLGILVVGTCSYYLSRSVVESEFDSLVSNHFQTSSDSLTQYLDYAEEALKMIANHPTIAAAVRSHDYSTDVSDVLNSLVFSLNLGLQGVSIYISHGYTYATSGYSDVPTLEQMADNDEFTRFQNDPDAHSAWIARYRDAQSFYNMRYRGRAIFSYVVKMQELHGRPEADLVADFDVADLTAYFQTNNQLFRNHLVYMLIDGSTVIPLSAAAASTPPDPAVIRRLNGETAIWFKSLGLIYVHRQVKHSNAILFMTVPTHNAAQSLGELRLIIMVLSAIAATVSIYVFIRLRNGLIGRLAALYQHMRKFNSKGDKL